MQIEGISWELAVGVSDEKQVWLVAIDTNREVRLRMGFDGTSQTRGEKAMPYEVCEYLYLALCIAERHAGPGMKGN